LDGVSARHNKLHIVPAIPATLHCPATEAIVLRWLGGSADFMLEVVLEDDLSLKEIGARELHTTSPRRPTRPDQSTTQKCLASMAQKQPKLKFETLKGRAQQIVTRLANSISVDDFAEEFKNHSKAPEKNTGTA
jgi:hypothetical protein